MDPPEPGPSAPEHSQPDLPLTPTPTDSVLPLEARIMGNAVKYFSDIKNTLEERNNVMEQLKAVIGAFKTAVELIPEEGKVINRENIALKEENIRLRQTIVDLEERMQALQYQLDEIRPPIETNFDDAVEPHEDMFEDSEALDHTSVPDHSSSPDQPPDSTS